MRHFELKWWVLTALAAGGGAATGVLMNNGLWAAGILAAVVTGAVVMMEWSLVDKVISMITRFVTGLEMNDSMMLFEQSGGRLGKMTRLMNRITEIYRSNNMELETRKLYYDRILRVMTHEMRNAITPVIALTEDMLEHGERYDRESREEALSVILSQSSGIKSFLDSYYTLTHLPEPKNEKIDGRSLFEQIMRVAKIEARELGIDEGATVATVANDLTLRGDVSLLSQAICNLVKNGLEAAACREMPEVRLGVTRVGNEVRIMIEDNGMGFEEKMQFQPFYSTKPGGSGVGLCLSRQIARLHGGDVRILSTSGSGTTMLMTIVC